MVLYPKNNNRGVGIYRYGKKGKKKISDRFKKVYWLVWLLRVVVLSYYLWSVSARARARLRRAEGAYVVSSFVG